jgi:hypothetical protein
MLLSSLGLFFFFERDTFFWKVVLVLFLSTLAILHFPFLSFISFLSVLVYFSFLSHIDGKWEAGCRACVHRTSSYGRAHRLSTLVVS